MSENIILIPIASFQNDATAVSATTANNVTITTAFSDCLSLSGTTPNSMKANLDMNNNQIINLPTPATVNSPARLIDVVTNPTITVPATGTSGHTVPFLDGANTWSGVNTFSVAPVFSTAITFNTAPVFNTTVTFTNPAVFSGAATFNSTAAFNSTFTAGSVTVGAISGKTLNLVPTATGNTLTINSQQATTAISSFIINQDWSGTNSSNFIYQLTSYGDTGRTLYRHAGGSQASPSQTVSGNNLFTNAIRGFTNSSAFTGTVATIICTASENFTNTANGSYFSLNTTPTGTNSSLTTLQIGPGNSVTLSPGLSVPAGGTTGVGYQMSGTTNLGLFFGSGAPTLSAAQGSIYIRTDGSSTSTRLYVNTNGSTTWTNFTSAT